MFWHLHIYNRLYTINATFYTANGRLLRGEYHARNSAPVVQWEDFVTKGLQEEEEEEELVPSDPNAKVDSVVHLTCDIPFV